MKKGKVVVISGPSGVGKSTLVKMLLDKNIPNLVRSVSATTRAPRPGEKDGVNYFFYTPERFQRAIDRGELIEHAEIYGHQYGVPKAPLEKMLAEGKNVILEIDVQGAEHVKELGLPSAFLFIAPPDDQTLLKRLRDRKTGGETQRLKAAQMELAQKDKYDVTIINEQGKQDQAVEHMVGALVRLGILKDSNGKGKA